MPIRSDSKARSISSITAAVQLAYEQSKEIKQTTTRFSHNQQIYERKITLDSVNHDGPVGLRPFRFFFLLVDDVVPEAELVLHGKEHIEMTLEVTVPTEQNLQAVHDASLADAAINPKKNQPDA